MKLLEAMNKAKSINSKNSSINARISKLVYDGYSVNTEPVELTIIKNSLNMLIAKDRSFITNVGIKYGK